MATVRDLIPKAELPGGPQPYKGLWLATFVPTIPALLTDKAYVVCNDIAPGAKIGPCFWAPRFTDTFQLPSLGDFALLGFDNRNNPWIIQWWPA